MNKIARKMLLAEIVYSYKGPRVVAARRQNAEGGRN